MTTSSVNKHAGLLRCDAYCLIVDFALITRSVKNDAACKHVTWTPFHLKCSLDASLEAS